MYRFLIIIEKGEKNYGAYAPDLPGCVATGNSRRHAEFCVIGMLDRLDSVQLHKTRHGV